MNPLKLTSGVFYLSGTGLKTQSKHATVPALQKKKKHNFFFFKETIIKLGKNALVGTILPVNDKRKM